MSRHRDLFQSTSGHFAAGVRHNAFCLQRRQHFEHFAHVFLRFRAFSCVSTVCILYLIKTNHRCWIKVSQKNLVQSKTKSLVIASGYFPAKILSDFAFSLWTYKHQMSCNNAFLLFKKWTFEASVSRYLFTCFLYHGT